MKCGFVSAHEVSLVAVAGMVLLYISIHNHFNVAGRRGAGRDAGELEPPNGALARQIDARHTL